MKDFNVQLTVRNNRLLRLVEEKFGSSSELARTIGTNPNRISQYMTMRETPVGLNGWKPTALDIAAALGVYPSDIWPEHLQDVRLKSATATLELNADEVAQIAQVQTIDQAEARDLIAKMSRGLPPRLMDFLRWRVTDGADATFDECGEQLGGVSRERARQIEAKMMRIMRGKAKRLGVESII